MEPMEKIRELLSRLTQLSTEEIDDLRKLILEEFGRVDAEDATPENVTLLQELADAGESLQGESQSREQARVQAEQDRETARERIKSLNEPEAEEVEEAPEDESKDDEPEETPAEEVEETPAEQPAQVASGSVLRMAARNRKPQGSPEASTPERPPAVVTASGALRVSDQNKPIEDRLELAEGMARTLEHMPKHGAPRGDVILASATWDYPDDRQLDNDPWENTRKIEAVTSPQALVATGGVCAPTNVDYAVPTWASAERPLRDGLPSFQATRGGLLYVQPPDIGALANATSIWTEATDASPGSATKPVLQVACGSTTQTYVDAVPTRLGFGNMQARFAPEQVAANTDLAVAAAARIAENNILNKIAAFAVADVTSATVLGATRDLLTVIDQVSAGYRYVHRISRSQQLTVILPDWLRDQLRADLAREIGHQQSNEWNSLAVSDQQLDDLLRAHGVNAIWHLDGQAQNGSVYPLQGFGTQGASGAVNPFPTKVVWYVFVEGMIQFLDGGRLDLGVVRDSTLDATNDYETFLEVFEGVANRGFANGVFQMVSSLCANGATAGTVSTAGSCA